MDAISWLNNNACEEDVIDGATFVGDARGDRGNDWNIYDRARLDAFVAREMDWTAFKDVRSASIPDVPYMLAAEEDLLNV